LVALRYGGLVKPDITFFGETLPDRFYKLSGAGAKNNRPAGSDAPTPDFDKCDLLIVMGTSLKVNPFRSLIDFVPADCPRVLVNRYVT
jgi:NAD-dependent SIR2 family protein deacetylase